MPPVVQFIVTILSWVLAAVAVFGFIDALRYPAAAYSFIGKLPKPAWLAILGIGAFLIWLSPISIFGIAGIIGMGVYFADVRPKIRRLNGV